MDSWKVTISEPGLRLSLSSDYEYWELVSTGSPWRRHQGKSSNETKLLNGRASGHHDDLIGEPGGPTKDESCRKVVAHSIMTRVGLRLFVRYKTLDGMVPGWMMTVSGAVRMGTGGEPEEGSNTAWCKLAAVAWRLEVSLPRTLQRVLTSQ